MLAPSTLPLRFVASLALVSLSIGACKKEGVVTVRRLSFAGVTAVDQGRLKNALATRESSRLPWGRKNPFTRARFDDDLKRIQAFYADRGYPDARVTDFRVQLDDKQDTVDISITLSEGQPVRVASVAFSGFEPLPPERLNLLAERTPLKVGQPRDQQFVAATRDLALNALRDQGYPYAKVTARESPGPGAREVDLSFDAEVGTLAHFGPVEIVGNRSVSERVIRRQLTYQPGDLYRRSLVQDVQQRLYGLQVFQFVHVEPLVTESQSPDVPTRITVAEGKHQRMNFGFGYGSEEKARADAEYRHLNFFGSARSAGIRGRWSSLDRGVRLDFTQPYFFGPHLSLSAEGQHWYSFTPAYESLVTGAKIGVTHRASQRTSWTVSVLSERDVSTIAESALNDPTLRDDLIALGLDPDTGEQAGTLSAVSFDYQRTTADNLLNPRRGYQLAFHYEDAGNLLPGTFQYFGLSTDARHYLPIGKSFVVGSRLALGNLRPPGDDATLVPFSKKYFLGGSTTIRGWGRYEVSPLSESGLPLGGNSMMAFSEEFRALTGGKIEVAAYLDGGNVWADSWGHKLDDLRYSVGSGLRYQTPIGPIRFDYGYQLNPIPNLQVDGHPQTRRWRIHFSIGQAF